MGRSTRYNISSAARATGPSHMRGQRSLASAFTSMSFSPWGADARGAWLLPERHFSAELPAEDRRRRPVPSTSSLATLGFTDCGAPFFAEAKLPSRNVSSHLSKPSPSRVPSKARHARATHLLLHYFNHRQQVAGEGHLSGRDRHADPVLSTQRMTSRQVRFEAHGRSRLSLRRLGTGSGGSINSHCASVSN